MGAAVKKLKTTRGASTIVQFVPSRKTVKLMNDVKRKWPKRLAEAKHLFLLDVGSFMVNELQKRSPDVVVGGKEKKYADDLRIGILEEGEDQDVIAIYMPFYKGLFSSGPRRIRATTFSIVRPWTRIEKSTIT